MRSEADAVAAGALDFGARACSGSAVELRPGAPPLAPGAEGAGAAPFFPHGGVHVLPSHPGFYMLPRALPPRQLRALAAASLQRYIEPPLCRRSLPSASPPGGLWADYLRALRSGAPLPPQLPLHALAWATLGVHYDWQRRLYPSGEAGWCSPFPAPLSALCAEAAACVQGAAAAAASAPPAAAPQAWGLPLAPYRAHAAIVSLYHASRSRARLPMGGHKDDAPGEDQRAPVLSFSMGATAVFLLGGAHKGAPPTPLLLRSGDVMLLAGEARDCVHGVPRVFAGGEDDDGSVGGAVDVGGQGDEEGRALAHFLASARINITVRSAEAGAPGCAGTQQ